MTIGQRIAQKRKEQTLSQEALGERLGVSRQSIYKWESDSALPEIDKLIALSRLFGVSVGWLLGVEEDAPPEAAAPESGELTEAQLNMVEEIVGRYIAAQPAPKPRRKWPWLLTGAVLVLVLFHLFSRLDRVDQQYSNLQNSVNNVTASVNSQISGISQQVESILKAQNNLAADYGTELAAVDLAANTATFSVYAVPKTYVDGMTVEFIAENGEVASDRVARAGEDGSNQRFSATVSIGLTDSITLSALFITPDGTRQTQLLDTYEGLYSETLPEVDVHDDLIFEPVSEDGVLALVRGHGMRYVWIRPYEAAPGAAAISEVRVGLFKNQKLLAWAAPCDKPASYLGFEGCEFFLLPEMEIPLTAEDRLQVAAVVTDEYGRVTVAPSSPYCIDPEDQQLTYPSSGHLDSNPANWEFE